MDPGIVCNLHGVDIQAFWTLAQAVHAGDVGTLVWNRLHQLQPEQRSDSFNRTDRTLVWDAVKNDTLWRYKRFNVTFCYSPSPCPGNCGTCSPGHLSASPRSASGSRWEDLIHVKTFRNEDDYKWPYNLIIATYIVTVVVIVLIFLYFIIVIIIFTKSKFLFRSRAHFIQ